MQNVHRIVHFFARIAIELENEIGYHHCVGLAFNHDSIANVVFNKLPTSDTAGTKLAPNSSEFLCTARN